MLDGGRMGNEKASNEDDELVMISQREMKLSTV